MRIVKKWYEKYPALTAGQVARKIRQARGYWNDFSRNYSKAKTLRDWDFRDRSWMAEDEVMEDMILMGSVLLVGCVSTIGEICIDWYKLVTRRFGENEE